jgi:hypothetical protein
LAQFLLRPVVRLLLNVNLDQLPGHLVTQCPGDSFQLRELDASREASGIKLSREFPGELAQAAVKLRANFGGILAHVRGPLQIAIQIR